MHEKKRVVRKKRVANELQKSCILGGFPLARVESLHRKLKDEFDYVAIFINFCIIKGYLKIEQFCLRNHRCVDFIGIWSIGPLYHFVVEWGFRGT